VAVCKIATENTQVRASGSYNPWDIYMHVTAVHSALNSLSDRTFAESDAEHEAIISLYHLLLEPQNGNPPDRYFVLNDMQAYYDAQKKVEDFFVDTSKWAEYAIHNIASMGVFSTDESIHNYAKLIWDIKPCPCDGDELAIVRAEYSEHDKCRIL
jgi:starch phosphorylase